MGPTRPDHGHLWCRFRHRSPDGSQVTASYELNAPGGTWDALDYGEYVVSVDFDRVFNTSGLPVRSADLGSFRVQIFDPSVIYVDSFEDASRRAMSLRTAIREANAAGGARTIISGRRHVPAERPTGAGPERRFRLPWSCVANGRPRTWSNETTGDLAILGDVTILATMRPRR
jgi:hypothetical protein